ncbi:hypothetical protein NA57DRAFT_37673 [Rhizodiscina lignyota]|uniref:PH domain-containing protein n=1 Tax=Rhizodiscina lignyota TaxID=1504668 RepID=A0A9P4IIN2_9PEZI|nr:hypothetical protein NA57DRAFT_37673 [Rhizodiscina lignyota]
MGSGRFDDLGTAADNRGSSVYELEHAGLQRAASAASSGGAGAGGAVGAGVGGVARSNTLKKKGSVSKRGSLKRSGSRRSIHAGSIKGVSMDGEGARVDSASNSVFYTPIPTSGAPTDILANRFQAWRKFLKDLITYFREIQASYDSRSKALLKVANVISNTNAPPLFLTDGGINDANRILRDYHKHTLTEANKARDIENDVIGQLSGLRADLAAKIKEIKSLSGDFKNSVEKEKEQTRKMVAHLEEALAAADQDPESTVGKEDPFVIKLGVDRQVERQIDEENYLHRAYLNLEHSGRELESIVIGEIQKAYNAFASILKRESDENYDTIERLRSGPITIPKDKEWTRFVESDPHFVGPDVPLRRVEEIEYPGKDHPAAAEVRAGMLERKSKYLKSYTPGWYVLSPTHLHEFKSADRIYSQPPVMSLFLPDQKLGSHSQPGSSSHKFMLKGRQTGTMHRGHSWVFRAETYETMLAWYDAIRMLTSSTGKERDAYVRKHARSMSAGSYTAGSISGDSGMEEDEADEVPYSANASMVEGTGTEKEVLAERAKRPQPGGRFPSDLAIGRNLRAPTSPSSGTSEENELDRIAAGEMAPQYESAYGERGVRSSVAQPYDQPHADRVTSPRDAPYGGYPTMRHASSTTAGTAPAPYPSVAAQAGQRSMYDGPQRHSADYAEWMAPAATDAVVGATGTAAAEEYWRQKRIEAEQAQEQDGPNVPPPRAQDHTVPIPITVDGSTDHESRPSAEGLSSISSPAGRTSSVPTTLSDISSVPPEPKRAGTDLESHTAYDTGRDGNANAKATGAIFPSVIRHNTDVTVGDLHIPGEYPVAPPGGNY